MCSNSTLGEPLELFNTISATRKVPRMLFNPIWAYWAPGSFLLLSQHTDRDAPPWGTWIRTLHGWRKVGKERKKKKKPSSRQYLNPQPLDYNTSAIPLCHNHGPSAKNSEADFMDMSTILIKIIHCRNKWCSNGIFKLKFHTTGSVVLDKLTNNN